MSHQSILAALASVLLATATTGADPPPSKKAPVACSVKIDKIDRAGYTDKPQIHVVAGRVIGCDAGLVSVVVYTRAEEGGNLFLQQNEKGPRTQLVNPEQDGHFAIPVWLGNRRENAERYWIYAVVFPQLSRGDQALLVAQTNDKTDQIEAIRGILTDRRVNVPPLKIDTVAHTRIDPKAKPCERSGKIAAPAAADEQDAP